MVLPKTCVLCGNEHVLLKVHVLMTLNFTLSQGSFGMDCLTMWFCGLCGLVQEAAVSNKLFRSFIFVCESAIDHNFSFRSPEICCPPKIRWRSIVIFRLLK